MSKDGKQGPAIDLSFGVELAAQLKAGLDGIRDEQESRWKREEELIPYDTSIRGGGAAPASGDLIFNVGGPPMGRAWVLRRLSISATDPTATAAGTAYFYASSAGDSNELIAATWFDWASTIPMVGWYTSRQVVIQSGQLIWVRIVSPTAGASYAVHGTAVSEVANERAAARYTI